MKFLATSILSVVIFVNSFAQSCNQLPSHFSSYSEAIKEVKGHSFKIHDNADVSMSSWIRSASYYSCDGETGYLIYTTNKGYEYIHKGVPTEIWEQFKRATSKGSYYDHFIKGRYRLTI